MNVINLFADIIPGKSAAGFELGMHFSQIEEIFVTAKPWSKQELQLGQAILNEPGWLYVSASELGNENSKGGTYYYGSGAVELHFNSNKYLDWIAVSAGYGGKLMGNVGVGDKLKNVADILDLIYDDVDELHIPADESSIKGIMFQADEAPLELSPDQNILRIIVGN